MTMRSPDPGPVLASAANRFEPELNTRYTVYISTAIPLYSILMWWKSTPLRTLCEV